MVSIPQYAHSSTPWLPYHNILTVLYWLPSHNILTVLPLIPSHNMLRMLPRHPSHNMLRMLPWLSPHNFIICFLFYYDFHPIICPLYHDNISGCNTQPGLTLFSVHRHVIICNSLPAMSYWSSTGLIMLYPYSRAVRCVLYSQWAISTDL